MSHFKELFFLLAFLFIAVLDTFDFVRDLQQDVSDRHLIEEGLVIFVSLCAVGYLLMNLRAQSRLMKALVQELHQSNDRLRSTNLRLAGARAAYGKVIKEQFDEWKLTHSEQEVALLLLKGLSFREIAGVRHTKEKTVRQQASEIYGKAGVNGRHAFSAWFFEDFLS